MTVELWPEVTAVRTGHPLLFGLCSGAGNVSAFSPLTFLSEATRVLLCQ